MSSYYIKWLLFLCCLLPIQRVWRPIREALIGASKLATSAVIRWVCYICRAHHLCFIWTDCISMSFLFDSCVSFPTVWIFIFFIFDETNIKPLLNDGWATLSLNHRTCWPGWRSAGEPSAGRISSAFCAAKPHHTGVAGLTLGWPWWPPAGPTHQLRQAHLWKQTSSPSGRP